MKCDYCGRYMSLVDYGAAWGSEWVCSQQAKHVEADPEHWSVFGDELTTVAESRESGPVDPTKEDKSHD